jgi:hypothetical protein
MACFCGGISGNGSSSAYEQPVAYLGVHFASVLENHQKSQLVVLSIHKMQVKIASPRLKHF